MNYSFRPSTLQYEEAQLYMMFCYNKLLYAEREIKLFEV
jgi:hypothetical protein